MHKFFNIWFNKYWWASLASINLFFIALTIAHPHIPNFQQKWRLITPFSLHTENNFAAWWSGITLLLAALLSYQRYTSEADKTKFAWLILAIVLAGLSLDEIGSFHERIGHLKGWSGILPFGVLLILLVTYVNIKLFQFNSTNINAKYLCISISLLFSVAIQEYIEHTYAWKPWMLGLRVGIEEGTELIATMFMLLAIIHKINLPLNLFSLLPSLNALSKLRLITLIGLIAHILGGYIITQIGDPLFRGNPMNWYPTSLYFCTALVCLHKVIHASERIEKIRWGVVLTLTLITSIGIMTNLFMIIIPRVYELTNTTLNHQNFMIIYIIQLISIGMLLTKKIQISKTLVISSLVCLFALAWQELYVENIWIRYSILGAFSYWTFYIFTSKNMLVDKTISNKKTS
jgi:hypothetical protein